DTGSQLPADAALLSWTAPLTRENGESLSMGEIAGYEVSYGLSPDNLNQNLAIGDASAEQLMIDQLGAGTWYFAIRTLDTDGNRGSLSEVVAKVINI
ncbi:MAG: fibronectin type III domain-containing protein, partial [Gammaproteobacteria bacterium]